MTERTAYSLDEAAESIGIGITKLRQEISAGRLVARKIGKRVIITAADLAAWTAQLPLVVIGGAAKGTGAASSSTAAIDEAVKLYAPALKRLANR